MVYLSPKFLQLFKQIALFYSSEEIILETDYELVIGNCIIVCFLRMKYENKIPLQIHLSQVRFSGNKWWNDVWDAGYGLSLSVELKRKQDWSKREVKFCCRRTKHWANPWEVLEYTQHKSSGLKGWYLMCSLQLNLH